MAKRTRYRGRKRRSSRRVSRRRSKKKFKRRRGARSRLADKRINTLVEKRMSQIAAKQIAKQHRPDYKFVRGLIERLNPNPSWATYWEEDVWPAIDNFYPLLPGPAGFFVLEIAKCGGYLENLVSTQMVNPGGMEPRDMYIALKSIQSDFRFVNSNTQSAVVDMQITRFGYDKSQAYFTAQPSVLHIPGPLYTDHPPFTSPHTLNGQFKKAYKEPTTDRPKRRWQVLARKRIVLKPTHQMDDVTAGAGANARVNARAFHKIKLAKYFKKAGQRERYKILTDGNEGQLAPGLRGSLLDHRYFLSIRTTIAVDMVGITSVKFAASGMLDKQMIFDRLAAGLNPGGCGAVGPANKLLVQA